jgi:hypothetical protein
LARAYESKEAVSEQQKRDIADLTMRNLRLEREGNRATEEDRRDAAKWRAFKEEEELEVLELCHESRADSIPGSLLPTVDDVQVCPECGGEHLIARHSDVFGCPHCGGEFKLSFVSS